MAITITIASSTYAATYRRVRESAVLVQYGIYCMHRCLIWCVARWLQWEKYKMYHSARKQYEFVWRWRHARTHTGDGGGCMEDASERRERKERKNPTLSFFFSSCVSVCPPFRSSSPYLLWQWDAMRPQERLTCWRCITYLVCTVR